jgi:hypothetical protein
MRGDQPDREGEIVVARRVDERDEPIVPPHGHGMMDGQALGGQRADTFLETGSSERRA